MGEVLNAIFLVASSLTLLPLLDQFIAPKALPDQVHTVRISLGVDQTLSQNADIGGNTPGVALWDEFGELIGTTPATGAKIKRGGFQDIQVVAEPAVGNIAPGYLAVSNGGDDAVCINSITVAAADGSRYSWTGDVAAVCSNTTGAFLYPSSQAVSNGNTKSTPFCVWIDRDGSNGIPHQGFGIHLRDFGSQITVNQTQAYQHDNRLMCDSGPRFRMYPQLRAENPILIFDELLKYDEVGVDVDPSKIIGNPGILAQQDYNALKDACTHTDTLPECTLLGASTPFVPIIDKRTATGPNKSDKTIQSPSYWTSSTSASDGAYATLTTSAPTTLITINSLAGSDRMDSVTRASESTSASATSTNSPQASSKCIKNRFYNHLVVSNQTYHSAKALCEHPYTYGPSMVVASEGLFCDMITKRIHPVCSKTHGDDCCFDMDTQTLNNCSPDGVNTVYCTDDDDAERVSDHVLAASKPASSTTSSSRFTTVHQW